MQVQGDDPVRSSRFDRVRAHAGPDRHARFVLLVSLGVTEIWDNGRHRRGAGTFAGIEPEQQFHEIVISRKCGGLHQIDMPTSNVFSNPHEEIAFRKSNDLAQASGHAKVFTDPLSQARAAAAAKNHHILRIHSVRTR